MTSEIKVNNIKKASGSTLTLGEAGTTVAIASGATTSGMGRTGTVDWQTGSIKTATFTAESGKGYFCNTTGGAFTVNLPAGSAGAIVSVQDYNNTFDSYALTVDANGSEKINGGDGGYPVELNTEGRGVTFVYVDSTVGWRSVQDNDFTKAGSSSVAFMSATGGNTIATSPCGNFKTHTFTSPGTFAVTASTVDVARNKMGYLVVGGGGAGGSVLGGGGGAGGFREGRCNPAIPYTASPLVTTGLTATTQSYSVVVGAGGTGTTGPSSKAVVPGSVSTFSTITSAGGGGGGTPGTAAPNNPQPTTQGAGDDGGSGGGVSDMRTNTAYKGAGNVPPVSPPQGNDGGMGVDFPPSAGGGGGGATGAGTTAPSPGSSPSPGQAGPGGTGGTTHITGSPVVYAGGGGGGIQPGYNSGAGGPGGGGGGRAGNGAGTAGTANLGGGGGGGGTPCGTGGNGGSGVVIIRYKIS